MSSNVIEFPAHASSRASFTKLVREDHPGWTCEQVWEKAEHLASLEAELDAIRADPKWRKTCSDWNERCALNTEYRHLRNGIIKRGLREAWLDNLVRIRLNRRSATGFLSLDELRSIMPEMRSIAADVDRFDVEVRILTGHMRDAFVRQVFGRGLPWTPAIKRVVKNLPNGESVDWMTLHSEAMASCKKAMEGHGYD